MAEVALPWLERRLTDELARSYSELRDRIGRGGISEKEAEEHFYGLINKHYRDFSAKIASTPPANRVLAFVWFLLHHAGAMMVDGMDRFWARKEKGGLLATKALIRATSRFLRENAVPDDRNIYSQHLAEKITEVSTRLLILPRIVGATSLKGLMDPKKAREFEELKKKLRDAPNPDAAQYFSISSFK